MDLIGASPSFVMGYIEAKFTEGMTWENHGDWHIDHIQPCCSFDLTDEELAGLMSGVKTTQKKLSAYFNTEDFTIIVHDGPLAGQEIPHVHIHVLPRQEGDKGKTLLALWPDSPMPSGTPDFAALAELCESIRGE